MTNRSEIKQAISDQLDGRRLIWFGTRGDDVDAAIELEEMFAVFSILAPHRRRHSIQTFALEELTGIRVDLDEYEIDEEPDAKSFSHFRQLALDALSSPAAVFTYRPSVLVSSLCFSRRDRVKYLGLFKDFQSAFEHKPWVESSVTDLGIPCIPWQYVANEEQAQSTHGLESGEVMLRRSRSSGGTGLFRVSNRSELSAVWPSEPEAYVSVAPYLDGGVPLNISGVVWHDGITLHPLSVQLIGIEDCTLRPFGYCGNDFAVATDLERSTIESVQQSTLRIGDWLRSHGYRGAFGVDFLLVDGQALFTEVNPRFQGSTHLSCEISMNLDASCLVLDHLASHLGLDAHPSLELIDYFDASATSHIVVHSTEPTARELDGMKYSEKFRRAGLPLRRSDVVAEPNYLTQPGATVSRLTVDGSVTTTGFDLLPEYARVLSEDEGSC